MKSESRIPNPESKPRVGWNPWPISIIAFFSVAILGFAAFIVFCNLHSTDLVAADYYEQEVHYQGQMERLDHARQLGGAAAVTYDPASQCIVVTLPVAHAAGHPQGDIQLYRPSAAGLDRQLQLEVLSNGTQTINAQDLRPGLWKVRVSWKVGDQEYLIHQQVVVGAKTT